ncbi:hypothetical protein [uncultured Corynebacterium sp.]|uniref:hypothetical protein n=1 Tax=uncultured Corynebacterium sp. TaxID=159447 RepID=UPI0025F365D4|nr:hypothetical protein [uncultured Corynebacterium sp.]
MEVSADLSVLLGTRECEDCLAGLPERLRTQDFHPASIFVIRVAESCPDTSSLAQEYRFRFGQRPQGIPVWRLIVNGETAQPLAAVTPIVADCLPPEALWLGSAEIGFTEMGLGTPAVWRAEAAQ